MSIEGFHHFHGFMNAEQLAAEAPKSCELAQRVNQISASQLKTFSPTDFEGLVLSLTGERIDPNAVEIESFKNLGSNLNLLPKETAHVAFKWFATHSKDDHLVALISQISSKVMKQILKIEKKPYEELYKEAHSVFKEIEEELPEIETWGVRGTLSHMEEGNYYLEELDESITSAQRAWANHLVEIAQDVFCAKGECLVEIEQCVDDKTSQETWLAQFKKGKSDKDRRDTVSTMRLCLDQWLSRENSRNPALTRTHIATLEEAIEKNAGKKKPQKKACEAISKAVIDELDGRMKQLKERLQLLSAPSKTLHAYLKKQLQQDIKQAEIIHRYVDYYQTALKHILRRGSVRESDGIDVKLAKSRELLEKIPALQERLKSRYALFETNFRRLCLENKLSLFSRQLLLWGHSHHSELPDAFLKEIDQGNLEPLIEDLELLERLKQQLPEDFLALSKASDKGAEHRDDGDWGIIQKLCHLTPSEEVLEEEDDDYPEELKVVECIGKWVRLNDLAKAPFNFAVSDFQLFYKNGVRYNDIKGFESKEEFFEYYKKL